MVSTARPFISSRYRKLAYAHKVLDKQWQRIEIEGVVLTAGTYGGPMVAPDYPTIDEIKAVAADWHEAHKIAKGLRHKVSVEYAEMMNDVRIYK